MLTPIFLSKLDPFPDPTLIPVSINLEIESPLLDSHISLMRKECEIKFFDLNSTLEPKLTLEPKVFFRVSNGSRTFHSWIQINHSTKSHLLLDIGIDHNDSVMIFQDWSCKENKFHDRILHDLIHIGDCNYVHRKKVNKSGFHEPSHYLDWVATLGPIRPPPRPPLKIISFFSFFLFFSCIYAFIHTLERHVGGF